MSPTFVFVAAALAGSVSGVAAAQTPTHALIPLPVIVRQVSNQQGPDDRAAARRINDHGGIVGFSESDTLGRHAFVWSCCDAPASLADRTTIDLSVLAADNACLTISELLRSMGGES